VNENVNSQKIMYKWWEEFFLMDLKVTWSKYMLFVVYIATPLVRYVALEWDCLWTAVTNGPVVHPQVIHGRGKSRWNDIDRGKPKNSGKWTCSIVTVFTLNPIWSDAGTNPGLHRERLALNHPGRDTAASNDMLIFFIYDCKAVEGSGRGRF
jgi:hypothetical protein